MSSQTPATPGAVFLSYAREDSESARRIADALRAFDVVVWFDQHELRGGDQWDATIRKQIKECALFMPIVSVNTQARGEGYFRREWKLASERTHDMAPSRVFLLPVVVDATTESGAEVPEEFLRVQWIRLNNGVPSPEFVTRVKGALDAPRQAFAMSDVRRNDLERDNSRSRRKVLLCLIAGVALAGVAVSLWKLTAKERDTAGTSSKQMRGKLPEKSIAVLPFENRSSEKDSGYFSDGISEELLNVLAKVPGLRVVARTSAFAFKGKNDTAQEIGSKLNVTHLVEGSVQRIGSRARITAQLTLANTGETLWSEKFDTELEDIFAAQDEIAGRIARHLQLKLGGSRRAQTVNPAAHRLVTEGRHFLELRSVGFAKADKAYSEAVRIDPQFAAAHAGAAETAMLRGFYSRVNGTDPADALFSAAKSSALRAMDLEPSLAEPHATLGLVFFQERRLDESEHHFREAIRLNPSYGMVYHWHTLTIGFRGKFDLALAELERAIHLDPLAHTALFTYSSFLHAAGRFEESLAAIDRAIAISNEVPWYHGIRAVTLAQLGRTQEAMAAARHVRQCPREPAAPPHWWADGDAIYVLQRGGAEQEAEDYLQELRAWLPPNSHVIGYAACALGRFEEGLRLLETVEPMCQTRLYFMPMMDSVQETPALRKLFEKLDAVEEYKVARETVARLRKEREVKK